MSEAMKDAKIRAEALTKAVGGNIGPLLMSRPVLFRSQHLIQQ